MDAKIGGNTINPNSSSNTDYAPVALKIYLLQLKSGTVKAFEFDQDGQGTQVVGASVSAPVFGSISSLRIYYDRNSTVFYQNEIFYQQRQFADSSLRAAV